MYVKFVATHFGAFIKAGRVILSLEGMTLSLPRPSVLHDDERSGLAVDHMLKSAQPSRRAAMCFCGASKRMCREMPNF